ncbi:hypothetical protein DL765_009436 [Monosporascus sp. GIB2]|nr:hypothetical protein DL765_009436 [Monosporascus sp. GIB2]
MAKPTPTMTISRASTAESPARQTARPALDIPGHGSHHTSRRNLIEQRGSPNPQSPGGSCGQSRPSSSGVSPVSGRSTPSFHLEDDGITIYTAIDRGYTAAEEIYGRNGTLDSTNESIVPRGPDPDPELHSASESNLGELIRSSLQEHPKKWLPIDRLFDLVNPVHVRQELSQTYSSRKLSPAEVERYTGMVCSHISYDDENTGRKLKSSCRCIFAILALMNRLYDAPAFLESGLSDRDLPLRVKKDPNTQRYKFYSHDKPIATLPTADVWYSATFDTFMMYQSYMLSPFFDLKSKNDVPFHDLGDDVALPFIEDYFSERRQQGHHGTVWRVKIHPAHHNFPTDNEQENPYFAVKELTSCDSGGTDFIQEVTAWAKSVGVAGHRHIIRLLATWRQTSRQKDSWYLLFLWANGNLRDYWYKHTEPQRDLLLVTWIGDQCLGLAEGLKKIHRAVSNDSDIQNYGIHGDIKPENILWYKDEDDKYGNLVICDFGFTRFHSRRTIQH